MKELRMSRHIFIVYFVEFVLLTTMVVAGSKNIKNTLEPGYRAQERCSCSEEVRLVCGSDGNLYPNPCSFNCATDLVKGLRPIVCTDEDVESYKAQRKHRHHLEHPQVRDEEEGLPSGPHHHHHHHHRNNPQQGSELYPGNGVGHHHHHHHHHNHREPRKHHRRREHVPVQRQRYEVEDDSDSDSDSDYDESNELYDGRFAQRGKKLSRSRIRQRLNKEGRNARPDDYSDESDSEELNPRRLAKLRRRKLGRIESSQGGADSSSSEEELISGRAHFQRKLRRGVGAILAGTSDDSDNAELYGRTVPKSRRTKHGRLDPGAARRPYFGMFGRNDWIETGDERDRDSYPRTRMDPEEMEAELEAYGRNGFRTNGIETEFAPVGRNPIKLNWMETKFDEPSERSSSHRHRKGGSHRRLPKLRHRMAVLEGYKPDRTGPMQNKMVIPGEHKGDKTRPMQNKMAVIEGYESERPAPIQNKMVVLGEYKGDKTRPLQNKMAVIEGYKPDRTRPMQDKMAVVEGYKPDKTRPLQNKMAVIEGYKPDKTRPMQDKMAVIEGYKPDKTRPLQNKLVIPGGSKGDRMEPLKIKKPLKGGGASKGDRREPLLMVMPPGATPKGSKSPVATKGGRRVAVVNEALLPNRHRSRAKKPRIVKSSEEKPEIEGRRAHRRRPGFRLRKLRRGDELKPEHEHHHHHHHHHHHPADPQQENQQQQQHHDDSSSSSSSGDSSSSSSEQKKATYSGRRVIRGHRPQRQLTRKLRRGFEASVGSSSSDEESEELSKASKKDQHHHNKHNARSAQKNQTSQNQGEEGAAGTPTQGRWVPPLPSDPPAAPGRLSDKMVPFPPPKSSNGNAVVGAGPDGTILLPTPQPLTTTATTTSAADIEAAARTKQRELMKPMVVVF